MILIALLFLIYQRVEIHSLRLRGLYSDSLQNFNTVWQWLSMAEGMQNGSQRARPRVLPGSELNF